MVDSFELSQREKSLDDSPGKGPGPNRLKKKLLAMFRSLQHRNYRLFFIGQLISLVGTWMQIVAQSWLIYRLTHSAFLLGLNGFLSQIPIFLISPVGGVIADRHNRQKILIATQFSALSLALILAFLTLNNLVEVWHVILLGAGLGIVNSIEVPARQSFIVEMVGKEDLSNAIALNSSMFNGARALGPSVAGILVALFGEGWCFVINALSYLALVLSLWLMEVKPKALTAPSVSAWQFIQEGFGFVAKTKSMRALLLLLGLGSFMGMPFTVLMPIFADEILQGGPKGLGFLMGMTGIGALLGALSLALREGLRGLSNWVAISSVGFGLGVMAFAYSTQFYFSAVLLVLVGFFMMVQAAAINTLVQSLVPDRLRGRVMAFYSMMFLGMTPFGALLSGVLTGPWGAPLTVAVGGFLCSLGGLAFWFQLPEFRREAREVFHLSAV